MGEAGNTKVRQQMDPLGTGFSLQSCSFFLNLTGISKMRDHANGVAIG